MEGDLRIRLLEEGDSFEALTELLHRAYGSLAAMGLRYMATDQDAATTRKRAAKGECYLALIDGCMIGTILLVPPGRPSAICALYERPDVARVSQFGVLPEFQRRQFGSQMMDFCEQRARDLGAAEIALDTADRATHLIEYYQRRGYNRVGEVQWGFTNYKSVLLSKRLGAPPP